MIDIHSHILYGVDDGPKDLTESLELARLAVKEGIKTIIATPHHHNGRYNNRKQDIIDKVQHLNEQLQIETIPLTVLPGQEPRIYGELLDDYKKGDILTLNDGQHFLFIELPSSHVPRYTEQLLYDIQLAGLTPIIVHPERNQEFMERPDLLYQLVKRGALTQITTGSLTGFFGKNIRKFTTQIIDANLTHFMASDAHHVNHRPFFFDEALDFLQKRYGTDIVYYFTENAQFLVNGENVHKEIPMRIKAKKFFGIF